MDFGIAGVAAITVICYLAGQLVKASGLDNKWIPIICGVVGGILGVLAMRYMPDYPAGDYITAVAVGIVSGFAATGINEAVKQIKQRDKKKVPEFSKKLRNFYAIFTLKVIPSGRRSIRWCQSYYARHRT